MPHLFNSRARLSARPHAAAQLLLLSFLAAASGTRCTSSPTCPLYASNKLHQCFLKSINHMWTWNSNYKMNFPGKGLYTLAKISKSESDCCYDIHVQGFMCHAQRNGTEVDGAVMAKEIFVRASAKGVNVDVVVKADDTITITDTDGTSTVSKSSSTPAGWSQDFSYGGDTIATVTRYTVELPSGRATVDRWRVSFAFGGNVELWPTSTYEASRKPWRRSQNEPIWVWINIPYSLKNDATGLCAPSPRCVFGPNLPYEWCEGDANCLPSIPADALFSSARIAELETSCNLASGNSMRRPPSTCYARPGKEVDFGFTTPEDDPTRATPTKASG